jgi:hypothetical protein
MQTDMASPYVRAWITPDNQKRQAHACCLEANTNQVTSCEDKRGDIHLAEQAGCFVKASFSELTHLIRPDGQLLQITNPVLGQLLAQFAGSSYIN